MKHILWISIVTGITVFSCSSSPVPHSADQSELRLPGMPALTDTVEIVEPDGLIGITPKNTSGTFQLLDSSGVVKSEALPE